MREKKTVFKLFFVWDFEKEERWLNEMAQEGWVLDNTGFSFYTFVRCEPGEYIIRLEMNPSSDYRAFVKELGAEYCAMSPWSPTAWSTGKGPTASNSPTDAKAALPGCASAALPRPSRGTARPCSSEMGFPTAVWRARPRSRWPGRARPCTAAVPPKGIRISPILISSTSLRRSAHPCRSPSPRPPRLRLPRAESFAFGTNPISKGIV